MFDKLAETTRKNFDHVVGTFQKQVDHTFQFVKNETDRQLQNQLSRGRFYQESLLQDAQHTWEVAQNFQRQATERMLEEARRLREAWTPLVRRVRQNQGEE